MNNEIDPAKIDVLSILQDLCRTLSRSPLTMDDVQQALANLPIKSALQPEPGTGSPAFIRLYLPESSQLALDTLEKTFGDSSTAPPRTSSFNTSNWPIIPAAALSLRK